MDKASRIKTDILPLERTPRDEEMCKFVLELNLNTREFNMARNQEIDTDKHHNSDLARTVLGLVIDSENIASLEVRIRRLWRGWTQKTFGREMELQMDILRSLKKNASNHLFDGD